MTERELNSLYYLNIELRRIKKQIEQIREKKREIELSCSIGGVSYSGTPKSPSYSNTFENKVINRLAMIEDLDRQLDEQLTLYASKQLEYERRKVKIENYIDELEDDELRSILKYRCIEHKSWNEIGSILYIDRRTASRKYYNFIKNSQKN